MKYFSVGLDEIFSLKSWRETVDLSALCLTEHHLEILKVQVCAMVYAGIWKLGPNKG